MTSLITPVPVLSSAGWITDTSGKIDALLAHFFESMKSQTLVYGPNVSSLQFLLQQYGNNPNELTQNLERTLETYLGRYYDLAMVSVTNDATINNTNSVYGLKLYCSITENGQTYSVGNLLKVSNSKLTAVTKIING